MRQRTDCADSLADWPSATRRQCPCRKHRRSPIQAGAGLDRGSRNSLLRPAALAGKAQHTQESWLRDEFAETVEPEPAWRSQFPALPGARLRFSKRGLDVAIQRYE